MAPTIRAFRDPQAAPESGFPFSLCALVVPRAKILSSAPRFERNMREAIPRTHVDDMIARETFKPGIRMLDHAGVARSARRKAGLMWLRLGSGVEPSPWSP